MAVHTWWPRTSAWVPAQNDVVFTPWVPDVLLCTSGLEIATDTVANATNIFSLATKNSSLVAKVATRFLYDLALN